MEQLGPEPRWEQPDRADGPERPPQQARRDTRGRPGAPDPEPRGALEGRAAQAPGDRGAGHPVVIGYDARKNSDVFARDTAELMVGAGLRALVLPRPRSLSPRCSSP